MKRTAHLLLLACMLLWTPGRASDLPSPLPGRLLHDYIGWLSQEESAELNDRLIGFDQRTSVQIAVIITDDLLGYEPNDYCTRLGEEWGVGQSSTSNGIIILVQPTGNANERRVYIATGYGIESVIPDYTALEIVNREMLPRFSEGQRYEGLDNAISVIMELAEGEYPAEAYQERGGEGTPGWIPVLVMLLLVFGIPLIRAARYSVIHHVAFWTAFSLMNRRSGKGSFDDFRGGRGPFVGGGFGGGGFRGGGGFGGFGGGSFGGGGAGGSW